MTVGKGTTASLLGLHNIHYAERGGLAECQERPFRHVVARARHAQTSTGALPRDSSLLTDAAAPVRQERLRRLQARPVTALRRWYQEFHDDATALRMSRGWLKHCKSPNYRTPPPSWWQRLRRRLRDRKVARR